jgi:cob(I)alamin adenosyltransferase
MMKDYNGETTTLNGQKLSKNAPAIHLEGTADELNAYMGLVKSLISDDDTRKFIDRVQANIMKLMAHVSAPENRDFFITDNEIAVLERKTAELSPPPENYPSGFQIPGKNVVEAQIHIARTIARRAERMFVAANEGPLPLRLNLNFGAYLNKLSEFLFVLSLRF